MQSGSGAMVHYFDATLKPFVGVCPMARLLSRHKGSYLILWQQKHALGKVYFIRCSVTENTIEIISIAFLCAQHVAMGVANFFTGPAPASLMIAAESHAHGSIPMSGKTYTSFISVCC